MNSIFHSAHEAHPAGLIARWDGFKLVVSRIASPTSFEVPDMVELEKGDRCLRLTMNVKYLPIPRVSIGSIRVAAAVAPIVGNNYHLKYVIMQSK